MHHGSLTYIFKGLCFGRQCIRLGHVHWLFVRVGMLVPQVLDIVSALVCLYRKSWAGSLEFCLFWYPCTVKLHSHRTADQPPTNVDQFLSIGRVKKIPALIEERIYPRSTPAVSALYHWCTHAQIPLFPTYHRPSGWPIPALYDQPRPIPDATTLTTLNIGPTSDLILHSRPQLNNLKLTWKVIYHWKRQPYFSSEPFSKTGN